MSYSAPPAPELSPRRGGRYARKYVSARSTAGWTAYLNASRTLNRRWLQKHIGNHPAGRDILAALDLERQREAAFAVRSTDRLTRDLPLALERPIYSRADRRARQEAVQTLMAREMGYARLRAREMGRRSLAAVNRGRVRQASPDGGFWMLGHAKEHTPGCLVMAGRFWPWVVLERVHPPRHPGCTAYLLSENDAVKAGHMKRGDRMGLADAIDAARGVMMEGEADVLLEELAVRERLVELGADVEALAEIPWQGVLQEMFREGLHPRDWRGRWINVPAIPEINLENIEPLLQSWFHPDKLEADRIIHPRSGWSIKTGRELWVGRPPEGTAEGPAVFDVVDHGHPDLPGLQMMHKTGEQVPIRYVYRGVSESEWLAIQRRGYISSDLRGVIADWEGTNAGVDPRTAVSYLPMPRTAGGRGRILKIRVDPADGWFTIQADNYIRTRARVPLDRVEAVSPIIAKDERTFLRVIGSSRLEALAPPAFKATVFHHTTAGNAAAIARDGFRMDVRNHGKLYGAGVYLFEDQVQGEAFGPATIPVDVELRNPMTDRAAVRRVTVGVVGNYDAPDAQQAEEVRRRILEMGHDGAVLAPDPYSPGGLQGGREIIVYDPAAIKRVDTSSILPGDGRSGSGEAAGGGAAREGGEGRRGVVRLSPVDVSTPEGQARYLAGLRANPLHEFITEPEPGELATKRAWLSDAGDVGVTVSSTGEAGNLFRNPTAPHGAGGDALDVAVANGATWLNCFDGELPAIYREHGFTEVSRLSFDPEQAPEGWNSERFDSPDIEFMAHDVPARSRPLTPVSVSGSWDDAERIALDFANGPRWDTPEWRALATWTGAQSHEIQAGYASGVPHSDLAKRFDAGLNMLAPMHGATLYRGMNVSLPDGEDPEQVAEHYRAMVGTVMHVDHPESYSSASVNMEKLSLGPQARVVFEVRSDRGRKLAPFAAHREAWESEAVIPPGRFAVMGATVREFPVTDPFSRDYGGVISIAVVQLRDVTDFVSEEFEEAKHPRGALGRFIRVFHGTSSRAVTLAGEHGEFRPWKPRDVANEVAAHYGLDPEAFYAHPYFSFSKDRARDPNLYVTTDRKVAESYARERSEQLQDALHTAHRMLHPQLYNRASVEGVSGTAASSARDELKRSREQFVADYHAAKDLQPAVVSLRVPEEALGAQVSRQREAGYVPTGTFTIEKLPTSWQMPDTPAWQWTSEEQVRVFGMKFYSYGDAVPGGYNGGFIGRDPSTGEELGRIEYQTGRHTDEGLIAWIHVNDKRRREGIGSTLYEWMSLYMRDEIKTWRWGFMTPEGAKLRWALQKQGLTEGTDPLGAQA